MILRLFLSLLLASGAWADPVVTRLSGPILPEQAIHGKWYSGTVKLSVTDQGRVRVRLDLKHRGPGKHYFAVHACVCNRQGDLVGGGGQNEVMPWEDGKTGTIQWDLRAPSAKLGSFQLVLYEDSQFVGLR